MWRGEASYTTALGVVGWALMTSSSFFAFGVITANRVSTSLSAVSLDY